MTLMTTFLTFPDAVDSLFTGYVDIFLKRLTTFSGGIVTFSVWMDLITP